MGIFGACGPNAIGLESELNQSLFWRGVLRNRMGAGSHLHGARSQVFQNRIGNGSQLANGQQALARLLFDLGQLLQYLRLGSRGQVIVEVLNHLLDLSLLLLQRLQGLLLLLNLILEMLMLGLTQAMLNLGLRNRMLGLLELLPALLQLILGRSEQALSLLDLLLKLLLLILGKPEGLLGLPNLLNRILQDLQMGLLGSCQRHRLRVQKLQLLLRLHQRGHPLNLLHQGLNLLLGLKLLPLLPLQGLIEVVPLSLGLGQLLLPLRQILL